MTLRRQNALTAQRMMSLPRNEAVVVMKMMKMMRPQLKKSLSSSKHMHRKSVRSWSHHQSKPLLHLPLVLKVTGNRSAAFCSSLPQGLQIAPKLQGLTLMAASSLRSLEKYFPQVQMTGGFCSQRFSPDWPVF